MLNATSCSSDSDDNEEQNSIKSKRISKIITESNNVGIIQESIFSYDMQGRIIEIKTTINSSSTKNEVYITTYKYGESLIIEREDIDGIEYDLTRQYPRIHTYTLSNGLIVKDTETRNGISKNISSYTYDNNGYMKSLNKNLTEESHVHNLVWNNGNLSEIEYLGTTAWSYTYSEIPWIKGMFCDRNFIPNTDCFLLAMGYYGKLPKTLPTMSGSYSYQYTVSKGYVIKMITTWSGTGETIVSNITWE